MHEGEEHVSHGGHGEHAAAPGHGASGPGEHAHPGARRYVEVALVLAVITAIEVGVYYAPSLRRLLVPILLFLSALKFGIVVAWYMHLKFDHRLFRGLFVVPLLLAVAVMVSLLFLFRVLVLHMPQ